MLQSRARPTDLRPRSTRITEDVDNTRAIDDTRVETPSPFLSLQSFFKFCVLIMKPVLAALLSLSFLADMCQTAGKCEVIDTVVSMEE